MSRTRRASVLGRDPPALRPPCSPAPNGPVGMDDRPVLQPHVGVDMAVLVQAQLQAREGLVDHSRLGPRAESGERRRPRALAFGQVAPRRAQAHDPGHPVDHLARVALRTACCWATGTMSRISSHAHPSRSDLRAEQFPLGSSRIAHPERQVDTPSPRAPTSPSLRRAQAPRPRCTGHESAWRDRESLSAKRPSQTPNPPTCARGWSGARSAAQ